MADHQVGTHEEWQAAREQMVRVDLRAAVAVIEPNDECAAVPVRDDCAVTPRTTGIGVGSRLGGVGSTLGQSRSTLGPTDRPVPTANDVLGERP